MVDRELPIGVALTVVLSAGGAFGSFLLALLLALDDGEWAAGTFAAGAVCLLAWIGLQVAGARTAT